MFQICCVDWKLVIAAVEYEAERPVACSQPINLFGF